MNSTMLHLLIYRATWLAVIILLVKGGPPADSSKQKTPKLPDPVRVTTIELAPFVVTTDQPEVSSSNRKFNGYMIDLLNAVAGLANFNYTINLVADNRWGSLIVTNESEWTGMVGELLSEKVDLAAAPLTITSQRETHVDFSIPFMTHGISIIMNKKDVFPPTRTVFENLTYFISPLSFGVWMSTCICAVLVGILLAANDRFNPYEITQRAQRGEDVPKDAREMFNIWQSLWFSFSSLFLQAFGVRPRSFSGRVLMAFWWFYSLVFVCTYLSSMVRTVPFIRPSVQQSAKYRSLEDIVHNIDYGVVDSGSIQAFFTKSNIPFYKSVTKNWTLVVNANEGFTKMQKGGYAFITDSFIVDYMRSLSCDYLSVGEILDTKYYGFAMRHGSPLRKEINKALLKLLADGHMEYLYRRWFHANFTYPANVGHACQGTKISRDTYTPEGRPASDPYLGHSVGLDVFGGPVALVIVGMVLSIIVLISEKMYFKFRGKARGGVRSLISRQSPYDDTTTEIVTVEGINT